LLGVKNRAIIERANSPQKTDIQVKKELCNTTQKYGILKTIPNLRASILAV
jgi:hypothetical protein